MNDCREIENLIYRYALLIDKGDLPGVANLFRDAEVVSREFNSVRRGVEEVLAMYQSACRLHQPSGTPLTKHLTTNVIIEVDRSDSTAASTATASSYYTVIQATPELPLQPIISGSYADNFHKVNGQWQFARREMFIHLMGNCSQHLLFDASSP